MVIDLFEKCHDDHPVTKYMGACNELKRQLTICLRAEVPLVVRCVVLMVEEG